MIDRHNPYAARRPFSAAVQHCGFPIAAQSHDGRSAKDRLLAMSEGKETQAGFAGNGQS
jgi:hypothetical protein